jgi:hypothetical protein
MGFLKKFHYFYTHQNDDILNKNIFHECWLMIDYFVAFLVHGCSITNYFVYGFYKMRHAERKKYVTWRRQRWIYRRCNQKEYGYLLRDKDHINRIFDPYLKRDWMLTRGMQRSTFMAFLERNPEFIVKPVLGTEGRDIQKISVEGMDDDETSALFDRWSGEDLLLERYIRQHPVLNALHPSSVNTIRVTTVRNHRGVHVMTAALRMGRFGAVMDNYTTGGIVAAVDLVTGIVFTPGVNKLNETFVVHPETGVPIVGVQIPFWEDVKTFAQSLGSVIPEIRYTGWDIAVTEEGPVLLEGNYRGNFHVQQHPDHTGKYEMFRRVIQNNEV